jgi:uncharacterized protein YndB with AHSA1/START domain
MMKLEIEGDSVIVVTRRFAATAKALYRAHTEPELIQQWLLGPDGSTMPVCICEPRPQGKLRYEWSNNEGRGFFITGEFIELVPYTKIVHVERMHLPDPTPDNHIVTTFTEDAKGTLMTLRMTLPESDTRSQMLKSGMDRGMEASYARLDGFLRAGQ